MGDQLPRYDVVILSEDPRQRVTPGAARSLLQYLHATRLAVPTEEAIAETWAEIYLSPGTASHEIFVKGSYADEEPVFLEGALRFGSAPAPVSIGPVTLHAPFFLELRGARFREPLGPFRKRLGELLLLRPVVHVRDHDGLLPHREVGDDEQPSETKRLGPGMGGGKAGVRVEER